MFESRRVSVVMSDYAMLLLPLLQRAGVEAPGVTIEVHPIRDQIHRMLAEGCGDLVLGPSRLPVRRGWTPRGTAGRCASACRSGADQPPTLRRCASRPSGRLRFRSPLNDLLARMTRLC